MYNISFGEKVHPASQLPFIYCFIWKLLNPVFGLSFLSVCTRARACVCVCARACVGVCVCARFFVQSFLVVWLNSLLSASRLQ